jgi:hypothetical protein
MMDMHAEVMEGSNKGFSVYQVTATDCDYDPKNKNLTYSISGIDEGTIYAFIRHDKGHSRY